MKSIEVPPFAPTLMESTRSIGYSIESAIADIIDNSIAANASQVDIDFFPIGEAYISIIDNGVGMSESELIEAMKYGSKSPLERRNQNDLGRYGLGLKTASLSQCRIVTVITKKRGVISGSQWNLDHINKEQSWSLLVLNEDECTTFPGFSKLDKHESGTLVIWQDLDKFSTGESDLAQAFSRKMSLIRNHLSLVFHRFLVAENYSKSISIRMNNDPVIAHDPFVKKKSTQIMADEVIYVKGEKVIIKPFILPHTDHLSKKELDELGGTEGLRKKQGFYIYRNKRLLVWGTWFRLTRQSDLSKLARVQVDIPNSLDDLWTLDIKKSTAIPPEEVKQNLRIIIDKIAESSKRTWHHRGKVEFNEKIIHIWKRLKTRNGGILYEIDRNHPLIKELINSHPGIENHLDVILKQISNNLPLNSLYLDLNNDEKMKSDEQLGYNEVRQIIKAISNNYSDNSMKIQKINALKVAEPFSNYIAEIEESMKQGEFYDN